MLASLPYGSLGGLDVPLIVASLPHFVLSALIAVLAFGERGNTIGASIAIWSHEPRIRKVAWIPPIPRGCAHSDYWCVREGVAAIRERPNSTTRHPSFPLFTGGLPTKLLAPAAVSITFVLFQDVPAHEGAPSQEKLRA
jgi:hypothetical protein